MSNHASFFYLKLMTMGVDEFLPADRTIISGDGFQFHCHPGVSCFLSCCRDVDLLLFPYDVILLKNHLHKSSSVFLRTHAQPCNGSHPFFPGLRLKMQDNDQKTCPFLSQSGCSVYVHRPSACRTYPLERAIESPGAGKTLRIHYFMTHHPYCQGHHEMRPYTVRQWERDQMLHECNYHNDLWAELDAFFATNPWAGEGAAGPYQQLAFMVCYNIDEFRAYVGEHELLAQYRLAKDERRRITADDGALLRFGFSWLETILGGRKKLVKR